MIIKECAPKQGQKIEVYVNLNKDGLFSIVDREPKSKSATSGKVIAYAESLEVENVVFKVADGRYNWIHENNRRAVCAVAVGHFVQADSPRSADLGTAVNYNPFRRKDFHTTSGETVTAANLVHFENKKAYIAGEADEAPEGQLTLF
ncbi:hypothetical protein M2277_005086 [Paenibacillus sp. LBL]|uniref:hypothetical protein n=1 Tax=Paenibacillus sp. LBL TaxID=2940563 RepID=UPI002474F629|nr:hypothetical protein [Paenibacillus sp. LBL]MDH6674394.1 hypothetical protein [Paenibacillus sp. LBL]